MSVADVGIGGHNQPTVADFVGDAAQVAIFCLNAEENLRAIFGLVAAATCLAEYLGSRCAGGNDVVAATGGNNGDQEDDKETFFQCAGFHD